MGQSGLNWGGVTLSSSDSSIYANHIGDIVVTRTDGVIGDENIILRLIDSKGYYCDITFIPSGTDSTYKPASNVVALIGDCHWEILSDGFENALGKVNVMPMVDSTTSPAITLPVYTKTSMTYDTTYQTFAKAGSTTLGAFKYCLCSFDPDTETYDEAAATWYNRVVSDWSTKVPTAKNSGAYFLRAYVAGSSGKVYTPDGEIADFNENYAVLNCMQDFGADYVTIEKKPTTT